MMLQQQLLLSFMYLSVRCWESSTITIEYYNASNDIPYSEMLALFDFYQSTAGDHWEWRDDAVYGARWNFTHPAPCTDSWQGIDCEWGLDGSYHVVNLTLSSYNLSGTLSDTISDLTQLVFLYLYSNQLTGSIPTAIGQLTHLEVLSFDLNQLTHTIPDSIVNLTNLTHIQLWNNSLTGTFPSQLCHLSRLTVIFLPHNHINGSLPNCVGNLTDLRVLILENNIMSGTIPSSLGLLTNIFDLDLLNNLFTGTLPDTLCDIDDLLYLYLYNNLLTGPLPTSWGHCTRLTVLSINANMISGTFPLELATVSSLEYLDMTNNLMTGPIPASIASLTSLIQLMLSGNCFEGSIPNNIGDFRQINSLFLDNNRFTGPIPASIGELTSLFNLAFHENRLSGTLPRSLSRLESIVSVNLLNNELSGSLEGVFNSSSQPSLSTIQLSHNQFTGDIPTELFSLRNLSSLSLESNCFEASLPPELCELPQLKVLDLSGLHTASSCQHVLLPGLSSSYVSKGYVSQKSVPACYFHMPSLLLLHLSGNSHTGTIPADISATLQDLSLSHNFLTGSIPSSVQDRNWLNLDLSHNRLKGLLRQYAVSEGQQSSLQLEVNRLSGPVPGQLMDMHNISILDGNLFSCKTVDDLPAHDPNRNTFECGSNAFNTPYLIFGIILVSLAFLAFVFIQYRERIGLSPVPQQLVLAWFNLHNSLEDHVRSRLLIYRRWLLLIDVVQEVTLYSSLYIIFVLSPVYISLNWFYRTTEQSYAWVVSLAFFSGVVAGSIALLFLIVFLCLVVVTIRWGLLKYSTITGTDARDDRATVVLEHNILADMNSALNGDPSISSFELGDPTTGDGAGTPRSSEVENQEEAHKGDLPLLQKARIYGIFLVINFSVTFGANIAYIYAVFNGSSFVIVLAGLLLSAFKLFWNGVCGPVLTSWCMHEMRHFKRDGSELFSVQLFAGLVNYIAIPCLTVAVVSPNCFYNLFVSADPVQSQYLYKIRYMNKVGTYVQYFDFYQIGSTSYAPPFVYSYQCSSSIITSYTPAFTYLCIFASFVNPIGQVALQQLHRYLPHTHLLFKLVQLITPRILTTTDEDSMKNVAYNIFFPYSNARQVTINSLTFLGILFTFGAAFPPLGFAVAATIVIGLAFAKLKIGRFLSLAIEKNSMNCIETVDLECRAAISMKFLHRSKWMLASFGSCFYSIFVFDEYGDQVGYAAFWILIFIPLAPLLMYQCAQIAARVRERSNQQQPVDMNNNKTFNAAVANNPCSDSYIQRAVSNPIQRDHQL